MQLGILTVDAALTIRTWDGWLASCTGITPDQAKGRPLVDVVPAVRERGLLPRFEQVLATGEVQVLAPALHRFLIPCRPIEGSPNFDRMGNDGQEGAAWIKARGGCILTEAEESCVVYGMPRSVVEAGLSDASVPLERLAEAIMEKI